MHLSKSTITYASIPHLAEVCFEPSLIKRATSDDGFSSGRDLVFDSSRIDPKWIHLKSANSNCEDEIDCLFRKLRNLLRPSTHLEHYLKLILQHLLKSIVTHHQIGDTNNDSISSQTINKMWQSVLHYLHIQICLEHLTSNMFKTTSHFKPHCYFNCLNISTPSIASNVKMMCQHCNLTYLSQFICHNNNAFASMQHEKESTEINISPNQPNSTKESLTNPTPIQSQFVTPRPSIAVNTLTINDSVQSTAVQSQPTIPPPPPPMVLVSAGSHVSKSGAFSNSKSGLKLKLFRWTKIRPNQNGHVWTDCNSIQMESFINLEKLDVLFHQNGKHPSRPMELSHGLLANGTNSLESEQQEMRRRSVGSLNLNKFRSLSWSRMSDLRQDCNRFRLLDSQRCLNINIYLRQFRTTSINLLQLICDYNSAPIGLERLKDLIKLLPTDHELETLQNFQGTVDCLDTAEKFFVYLIKIPKYKEILEIMLCCEEMPVMLHWIQTTLERLTCLCQSLLNSSLFHDLLKIILNIGNYLNKDDTLGNAQGFTIQSLLKMAELKSNDSKMTLLHFLVQELRSTQFNLLKTRDSLPYLKELSDVSLDSIQCELNKLNVQLDRIEKHIDRNNSVCPTSMKQFVQQSRLDLNDMEQKLNVNKQLKIKCAEFLGLHSAQFDLSECFQTLNLFFDKMDHVEQELREQESRKQSKANVSLCQVQTNGSSSQIHMAHRKYSAPVFGKSESNVTNAKHTDMISAITEANKEFTNKGLFANYLRKRPSSRTRLFKDSIVNQSEFNENDKNYFEEFKNTVYAPPFMEKHGYQISSNRLNLKTKSLWFDNRERTIHPN